MTNFSWVIFCWEAASFTKAFYYKVYEKFCSGQFSETGKSIIKFKRILFELKINVNKGLMSSVPPSLYQMEEEGEECYMFDRYNQKGQYNESKNNVWISVLSVWAIVALIVFPVFVAIFKKTFGFSVYYLWEEFLLELLSFVSNLQVFFS